MARTALFNWAFARHHQGTFVFRIEDTDAARDSEDSCGAITDALRWLHLDWDEGPDIGGPYGPYRQSQRLDLYADVARQLREAGAAYDCYCTPEEVQARAEQRGGPPGYDGFCRELSSAQRAAFEAEGRQPVLRYRMPGRDLAWTDLVRGDVAFAADHVRDYVLVRANGHPLYTLTNPVDDAAMRVTHVLRGEDLLSSTPRQIALWESLQALGVADHTRPEYGHLPYVMGEGNKKLSKRDPRARFQLYVEHGYVSEGLVNYLALLGWSLSEDRDRFSLDEMVAAFDISRVNPSPARFDSKKCLALNGDWIRMLPLDDLTQRLVPFLQREQLVADPMTADEKELLARAVPLVHERMPTLVDGVEMMRFLVVDDEQFSVEPAEQEALATDEAQQVLTAALDALQDVEWLPDRIEAALRVALVEGLGRKPKHAFGPVRIAVTGRRVSPPLFESLQLLGRETAVHRITQALQK